MYSPIRIAARASGPRWLERARARGRRGVLGRLEGAVQHGPVEVFLGAEEVGWRAARETRCLADLLEARQLVALPSEEPLGHVQDGRVRPESITSREPWAWSLGHCRLGLACHSASIAEERGARAERPASDVAPSRRSTCQWISGACAPGSEVPPVRCALTAAARAPRPDERDPSTLQEASYADRLSARPIPRAACSRRFAESDDPRTRRVPPGRRIPGAPVRQALHAVGAARRSRTTG